MRVERAIVSRMREWLVLGCAGGFAFMVEGCTFDSIGALTSGSGAVSVNQDSGVLDAGVHDSGVHDSGVHDASQPDSQDSAVSQDAASGDAMGVADGGADAGHCPPTPPVADICKAFGPAPNAPVIDGTLDFGIPLWQMPQVLAQGPDTAVPAGVTTSLGVGWRPDGLYVYVEVTGLSSTRYPFPAGSWGPYCGDAIELFVDSTGSFPSAPAYNIPGTIQIIMAAPSTNGQTSNITYPYQQGGAVDAGPPQSGAPRFIILATDVGYTAEAFVQAADLGLGPDAGAWPLAAAGRVGFDVAIDVGSANGGVPGCPRQVQFTIQLPDSMTPSCDLGCDVSDFCTPTLLCQ
jgi:hypothetical protein